MALVQTKLAPMGANMKPNTKASTEQRLDAVERNIIAMWVGKMSWWWAIPSHLAIMGFVTTILFAQSESRFNGIENRMEYNYQEQAQHNLRVDERFLQMDDRLRIVEINQGEFKGTLKVIVDNQGKILGVVQELQQSQ